MWIHSRKREVTSRAERAARALELRQAGLLQRQIAGEMQISVNYVSDLLVDPTGDKARARKDRYRLPCPQCGRPMDGSGGHANSPKLCTNCMHARQYDERRWNRDAIVQALRAFRDTFGRTPTPVDANPSPSQLKRFSQERRAEIERSAGFGLPSRDTVAREFGSWSAGIKAAGLPPAPLGTRSHRKPHNTRQRAVLARLAQGPASASELKTT